jgi:Methylamine utilisation protein MauE
MTAIFVAACVSVCLALSGGFKLFSADAASDAARQYTALRWLPGPLHSTLAQLLPPIELATAICLLVPQTARWAALGAVCLSVAFLGIVALDDRPTIAHCGCWGVVSPDIPKTLFVVRNTILLGAAAGAVAATWVGAGSSGGHVVVRVVAIGVALPFALFLLELPQIGRVLNAQRLAGGEAA